jgi:hypothetical protein
MLRLVQRDKGQSAKPMSMSMVAKAPHTRQGKFGATSSHERPPEVRLVAAQLHEVDAAGVSCAPKHIGAGATIERNVIGVDIVI